MSDPTATHHWMTRVAPRSSSSAAHVLNAHFAACVLDPLGHARPQRHVAMESIIG
jgi:hypothetical protein